MKQLLAILVLGCACEGSDVTLPGPPDGGWPDLGRTAIDKPTPGVLGLTFDDGPSQYTTDILAVLAKHQVHATFFVIGANIPGRRDVLDAEQAQGHQIGNHTFYHEIQPTLPQDLFDQRTLAVKANIGDRDNGNLYFRFPYGLAGQDQLGWLAALDVGGGTHYKPVGWNMDSQDWEFASGTSASILDDAPSCGGQNNPFQADMVGWAEFLPRLIGGGVILFHDIEQVTHDHIDAILTGWQTPAAYWSSLPAATAQAYQTYYACEGASPNATFTFQSLDSGAWPSLAPPF